MKYFFLLFIIVFLLSCGKKNIENEVLFPSANWIKFNQLNMEFPMEAKSYYSFHGIIKTDSSFKRRKIEMGFYLTLPSGEKRLIDHNFRILDLEYKPMGSWKKTAFENKVVFNDNIYTDESGTAKLQLVLHSQYYYNPGIVGIIVIMSNN